MESSVPKISPFKVSCMVIFAILAIVAVMALFGSMVQVEAGTIAAVTRFGEVTDEIFEPGLNWKTPFVEGVRTYNTQKITYETSDHPETSEATYTDYPVDTTTKDGQQVSIRYTVRFAVDPSKVQWVANNVGTEKDIVEKVVKTDSRIQTRNIPREYNAEELYTGNVTAVSKQIEETLRPLFEENGLYLDEFGIRQIEFEQDYVDTIEAKQIEKEKVKTEQHKAEQEKFKKEQAITRAEAEAKSQELQQKTLTEFLLRKQWIERWDGKLPTYLLGDADVLLQLPKSN